MRIAVIGAGMAGLSCADGLALVGHEVTVLDKGRGPGGRMSTRRVATPAGEIALDHGAQYFTARSPGFRQQVAAWAGQGVIASWPLPDPAAWVGTPGMNAVIKAMAAGHDVRWGVQVERIERDGHRWRLHAGGDVLDGFDAVVLAIPAEQAVPFLSLHDFAMAREAMLARSQPCWTGLFAFDRPLPTSTDMIRDTGNIGWAVRNACRPGRPGSGAPGDIEGWVVQARPEWSQAHLEDDAASVVRALLAELAQALDAPLPEPVVSMGHRWRYAMSAGLGHGALWNAGLRIGVCGDWLLGPRVECAWLSGQQLARAMAEEARLTA